jgi:hypothetical protein
MARYCPNCSAELKVSEAECWNCGALFGPNSSWAPTDAPSGVFAVRESTTAIPEREERHATGWPRKNTVVTLAMLVRTLLQVLLISIYLVAISGALIRPMTDVHIGDMIGVSLFFVLLFVATLSIGESKEKQSAHILGFMVNPKSFGVMLVGLGAFMLFAAWRVFSGQALGESPPAHGRGTAIVELLFQIPMLLVPAGVALAWYGVKLFRARQPSRKHRRRNAA